MALIQINETISYSMDDRLKRSLDNKVIPSLQHKDKDYLLAIDGAEGSGKSWLAFQIGKYVDPTLDLSRVTFNGTQFKEAILSATKGQCVIFDEAFTGLSSRSALSEVNRMLVSLMMQMRQKNLFVIIVLPTIHLLDKYAALFRARSLIHVYENKGRRGYFLVFNQKKKRTLFLRDHKTYSYNVRTRFKGHFYGVFALGDKSVEQEYRKMKAMALEEFDTNTNTAGYADRGTKLMLRAIKGMLAVGNTWEEIGKEMGMTAKNAGMWYHRHIPQQQSMLLNRAEMPEIKVNSVNHDS